MFNSNRSDLVGALNATTEDRVESVRQRAKDLGFTMIIGGSRMFLITKTDTGTYDVDCQSYGNTVLFESKLDEIMKTRRTRWQPEFNKLVGMIAICKGWDLSYENDCVHLKKAPRSWPAFRTAWTGSNAASDSWTNTIDQPITPRKPPRLHWRGFSCHFKKFLL